MCISIIVTSFSASLNALQSVGRGTAGCHLSYESPNWGDFDSYAKPKFDFEHKKPSSSKAPGCPSTGEVESRVELQDVDLRVTPSYNGLFPSS